MRWNKHIDKISAVHVVTKSELDEMHQYLKIPKDKMTIIPHGVNHDIFKPAENKSKNRKTVLGKFDLEDQSYFIHISEINYARKNLFRILDAFKKAREQKIPQKLILVGKTLPSISKKNSLLSLTFPFNLYTWLDTVIFSATRISGESLSTFNSFFF